MRRPRVIAEQARNASGLLGRFIAFVMARETWSQNARAIEALDIREDDQVLDVGCGHGRSLGELAARAPKGHIVGVDPSELMAEIAVSRNRRLVKAGRIEVVIGSADALPLPDRKFDRLLCVHTIYFWKDLRPGFREFARVLKPGGRMVLVFRSARDEAAVRSFPPDIYRFPELAEVEAALHAEGFVIEDDRKNASAPVVSPHMTVATKVVDKSAA